MGFASAGRLFDSAFAEAQAEGAEAEPIDRRVGRSCLTLAGDGLTALASRETMEKSRRSRRHGRDLEGAQESNRQ